MQELDEIDRKILRALERNGRLAHTALAEMVGLTTTPLRHRVERLEREGVIQGYRAVINPEAVGLATTAFIHVTLKDPSLAHHERFVAKVAKLPEVIEAHHLAGAEDFLLKVQTRDLKTLERFILEDLSTIRGLGGVKTTVVLSSVETQAARLAQPRTEKATTP